MSPIETLMEKVASDPELQQRVGKVATLAGIIPIAASHNLLISAQDIRGWIVGRQRDNTSSLGLGDSELRHVAGSKDALACTCCGSRTSDACST
mgnify:CR=1 FL=1